MSRLDEYDLEGVIRFSDGRENNNYKERERELQYSRIAELGTSGPI